MRRRTPSTTNNNSNFTPADAFLRLELVDAKGGKHRLPKDLALHIRNHVSEQMINAALKDPEKEFNFVATVHVVTDEAKEDITL